MALAHEEQRHERHVFHAKGKMKLEWVIQGPQKSRFMTGNLVFFTLPVLAKASADSMESLLNP